MNTEILSQKIDQLESICTECGIDVPREVVEIKQKIENNREIVVKDHIIVMKKTIEARNPELNNRF